MCLGTLDAAPSQTGLLIVTGGNEIRSGAHSGQARLAAEIAAKGFPVFRYDRRGVGDSEGINAGFLHSADDIAAAAKMFRVAAPQVTRIVGFGNCDAASSLALFGDAASVDKFILANPWVYDHDGKDHSASPDNIDAPALPPASAIWKRYLRKLTKPREIAGLLTGKVDVRKLARGLKHAATGGGADAKAGLSERLAIAIGQTRMPVTLLICEGDRTAQAFLTCWNTRTFHQAKRNVHVTMTKRDTASHSFTDTGDFDWLRAQILAQLSEG